MTLQHIYELLRGQTRSDWCSAGADSLFCLRSSLNSLMKGKRAPYLITVTRVPEWNVESRLVQDWITHSGKFVYAEVRTQEWHRLYHSKCGHGNQSKWDWFLSVLNRCFLSYHIVTFPNVNHILGENITETEISFLEGRAQQGTLAKEREASNDGSRVWKVTGVSDQEEERVGPKSF